MEPSLNTRGALGGPRGPSHIESHHTAVTESRATVAQREDSVTVTATVTATDRERGEEMATGRHLPRTDRD